MRGNILRIRPAAAAKEGLSHEELHEFVVSATRREPESSLTFEVSVTTNPRDPEILESLGETLRDMSSGEALVVIDIAFPPGVPRGHSTVDTLLYGALCYLRDTFGIHGSFLILSWRLPGRADSMFGAEEMLGFEGRLMFAEIRQECRQLGAISADCRDGLRALARSVRVRRLSMIRAGLLRRRGVFRSSSGSRTSHHVFYYEALESAQEPLKELLSDYLRETSVNIVVFDPSNFGRWFASCINAACLAVGIASIDGRYLREEPDDSASDSERRNVARARSMLSLAGVRVCFAAPAVQSGRTLSRLFEASGLDGIESMFFLTILLANARAMDVEEGPAAVGRVEWRWGGRGTQLDYVAAVPLSAMKPDDWKILAGSALGEIEHVKPVANESLLRPLAHPGRVAMWSLFEEYGVAKDGLGNPKEFPVPDGRVAIRYFPNLRDLDDWDAHWLAEAAVARIVEETNCARAALLILLPKEDSGSVPISAALREKCRAAVMTVSRDAIGHPVRLAEKDRSRLLRHASDTIVVFDESAVSHSTSRHLGLLVREVLSVEPALYGAIVDLGSKEARRGTPFFSFAQWSPFESVTHGA